DVRETGFELTFAPSTPNAQWTDAIRRQTPPEAIVVMRGAGFPVSAFTNRALFAPADRRVLYMGYHLYPDYNLVQLRGYDRDKFNRRFEIIQQVFGPGSDQSIQPLLKRLRTWHRPLVLVFGPQDDRAFLNWLTRQKIGTVIDHDSGGRVVYLIPN